MWKPIYKIVLDGKTVRKDSPDGKELTSYDFTSEKKAMGKAAELFRAANEDPKLRIEATSNTEWIVMNNARI
jgi:hypothetical protein